MIVDLEARRIREAKPARQFYAIAVNLAQLEAALVALNLAPAGDPEADVRRALLAAAEDTLQGVPPALVAAKVAELPTPALLEARAVEVARQRRMSAEDAEAHAAVRARHVAETGKRVGLFGRSTFEPEAASDAPELKALAKRQAAEGAELGLHDSPHGATTAGAVREASNLRLRTIGLELARRWRSDGAAKGLVKARAEAAKLRSALADATVKAGAVKLLYAVGRDAAHEAAAVEATRAVAAIGSALRDLEASALDEYGVTA